MTEHVHVGAECKVCMLVLNARFARWCCCEIELDSHILLSVTINSTVKNSSAET